MPLEKTARDNTVLQQVQDGRGCTGPDGLIPYQQEFYKKIACGCIF